MGIFDWFRRPGPRRALAATQSAGGGVTITTPEQLAEYLQTGEVSAAGARVTSETAMRVAAVYACVRIISGAVANMPLQLKRRIDQRTREDAEDHDLWTLLRRRPNSWQTPSQFRRLLTVWAMLRGNGCALKVKSRGRVIDLIPLHPDRLTREQGDDLKIRYTFRSSSGVQQVFEQEDVFDLMGMSLDGVNGVSPIRYARETIGLALEAERHGSVMFSNGAAIPGQINHPGAVGKEGLEFLKASLDEYRAGGSREGKWLILEEGAEVKPIGLTNEDAQYIETRKFSRSDIAMFFGVPPHMIGDTEKSTSWGSGIEQQSQGFVAYTLQDWLTAWEESIARDLITEPNVYARHNTAALVRGSLIERYQAHATALQWGIKSPNEVRADEDMNPRTDPGGDSYASPPNTPGAPPEGDEG